MSAINNGQMEEALPFDSKQKVLYPVSVQWLPPFTIMTDLVDHGELQVPCPDRPQHHECTEDFLAAHAAHRTGQPSCDATHSPGVGTV